MPDLASLSTGTKLLLGAGILLLIDTFFAWQKVTVEFAGVEAASASANAWHGFFGIVMGLLLIALLVWVGLQVAGVAVNVNLPAPETTIVAAVGALIFLCALLKNLIDDYSAWASYVGIALAALVAIGGWLRMQEGTAVTAAPAPAPTEPETPPASTESM